MAGLLDSPSRDEYLSRRASEREAYFAKRAEMRRNGERDFTGADAARFAAEMTPILGDAMAVKELWEEATSESPNWGLVGLLGGTAVLGLIPGVGDAAAKAVKAGAQGLLDMVKRVEVDPDAMGSLLGNVRFKPKGDFDVTRKDASGIFGEGSERVRYTDPKSKSTMEVVVRPDGSASVLDLVVPDESRGKGLGQNLQAQVMKDFPMMGGQVSSKAAATTAYRLGRRPVGQPNATLDDVFAAIDDMSSVNLVSPDMQKKLTSTTRLLPDAKNNAEQIAKDILELRAAGRSDEVTEQMMAAADDPYMYANTPISMSQETRMARADEMFPRKGFHGTNADIEGFQGNVFSTDNPTLASTYAKGSANAQMYPLRLGSKFGDTVVEGGGVNWNQLDPDKIYETDPAVAGWLNYDLFSDGASVSTRSVEQAAMQEGRSGVQFKDINDIGSGFNSRQFKNLGYTPEQEEALRLQYLQELSKPSNVDVRLSPNLVRSEFARFDPEFRHLKNLSAAVGIAPAGLLTLQEVQKRANEEQQRQGLLQ